MNLVDTAGLRAAADVGRGRGRAARAQRNRAGRSRAVHLGCRSHVAPLLRRSPGRRSSSNCRRSIPVTLVFNKIDLSGIAPRSRSGRCHGPPRVFLSALTGAGLALLRGHLKDSAGYQDTSSPGPSRRAAGISMRWGGRAGTCRSAAEILSDTHAGLELFAEDLRLAQQALGRNHRRVHQRGFARRDIQQLLYREMKPEAMVRIAGSTARRESNALLAPLQFDHVGIGQLREAARKRREPPGWQAWRASVITGKRQNSHTMVAADSARIANSATIFVRVRDVSIIPFSPPIGA